MDKLSNVVSIRRKIHQSVNGIVRRASTILNGPEEQQEAEEEPLLDIQVGSFPFMRYQGQKKMCDLLENEFYVVNAVRFRAVQRMVLRAGMLWFCAYLLILRTSEETTDLTKFFYILIIVTIPVLHWGLNTEFFTRYSQVLSIIVLFTGGVIFISHKIYIQDFSNMILTLYVILVFTATPLTLVNAMAVAGGTLAVFISMAFFLVSQANSEAVNKEQMAMQGLINIVSFSFLVYVTYYRELSLRKAVLSHHILLAKAQEVEREVEKTHKLLLSMLPDVICDQLRKREAEVQEKDSAYRIAEKFGSVTVMFVEICDFNRISSEHSQDEILDILNTVYSIFDAIVEDYDVYKVETVGQVYLVVGGCPRRSMRHSEDTAELALEFTSCMPGINQILRNTIPGLKDNIQIRIGLNTGAIVAGVVGQKSPRYKLFGDPVNTASRMQSTCLPGKIQCSAGCYKALKQKFDLEYRAKITVKGKGEMDTYFLIARKDTINTGRNAVRDKSEMHQRIAQNQNMLFRSYDDGNGSYKLRRDSRIVPVSDSSDDIKDDKRDGGGQTTPSSAHSHSEEVSVPGGSSSRLQIPMVLKHDSEHFGGTIAAFYNSVFSIGGPQFRSLQFKRGVVSISKLSTFLIGLITLPYVACLAVDIALPADKLPVRYLWQRTLIYVTVGYILLLIIRYLSSEKFQRYHSLLRGVASLTYCCISTMVILNNVESIFPNPSFLMVIITVLFNLAVVPMFWRFLLAIFSSVTNCVVLYYFVEKREYKRYMLDESQIKMDQQDVLLQFVLLIVTILLQTWCVATQDRFLYQDFAHNEMTTHQNFILQEQKQQTYSLLSQLLPPSIVSQLVESGLKQMRIVDRFESVTVLFTDMVNFTSFSQKVSPLHLMDFLNIMYTRFDAITQKYNLYKVEIIGDAYFIVGGCPIENEDHTARVLLAAHEMLAILPELCLVAKEILENQQQQQKEKYLKEARLKSLTANSDSRLSICVASAAAADGAGAGAGDSASASASADAGAGADAGTGASGRSAENAVPDKLDIASPVKRFGSDGNKSSDGISLSPGAGAHATPSIASSELMDPSKFDQEVPMPDINIRIGVHVGSVIAGVVGVMDPRYHVFGEAVSLANMMESKGKPGKVHITQNTLNSLRKNAYHASFFDTTKRDPIDLSPIVSAPQTTYFCSLSKDPTELSKKLEVPVTPADTSGHRPKISIETAASFTSTR